VTTSDRHPEQLMPGSLCTSMPTDSSGQAESDSASPRPTLSFTGERIVPGQSWEPLFREHEARYAFASRFVKGKAALDVGCGTGIGTHYLLSRGARVCLGLDIDGPSIDYARATYKDCQFAKCEATSLCVPNDSMDVVVCFETIEHLRNHLKLLSECHRVLRSGGVLLCSTPNRTMSRWTPKNPFHLHEFTVAEFARALETTFGDVRVFSQKNVNPVVYAGRCLLSRTLHRLQLMGIANRFLRRESPRISARTEFGDMPIDSDNEIKRYRVALLVQPRFIVAVAKKSA